jgi:hypothetical protein
MSDKGTPQKPPPRPNAEPSAPRGIEWGRMSSPVFRVGPVVGGPRLFSGQPVSGQPVAGQKAVPQSPAAPVPPRPAAARPLVPRPVEAGRLSVLSGSLVPQPRREMSPQSLTPRAVPEPAVTPTSTPEPASAPVPPRAVDAAIAPEPMAALEPAPVMPERVVAAPLADGPRRRQSRRGLYGVGAVAVVVIGGVAAFFLSNRTPDPVPVTTTEPAVVAPVEAQPMVEDVAAAPVPAAPVSAPVRGPVRSVPREPVVAASEPVVKPEPIPVPQPQPQPQPQPEPESEIRIAPAPVGPGPTPAQPQPTDPDAPIVTRPQPLDG